MVGFIVPIFWNKIFCSPRKRACVALLGAVTPLLAALAANPAPATLRADPELQVATEMNFPEAFVRRVRQRALLDAYAARFHALEAPLPARPMPSSVRSRPTSDTVRVVRPALPGSILTYRQTLAEPVHPMRGFQAPILDQAQDLRAVTLADSPQLNASNGAVASVTGAVSAPAGEALRRGEVADAIRMRLASAGLLPMLVVCVDRLGPPGVLTNAPAATRRLRDLGYPVDWLRHFRLADAGALEPADWVRHVAAQLVAGRSVDALQTELRGATFAFRATRPGFRAAAETGEQEIGLLRLQLGGGFQSGVVRGGSLDVADQLLEVLTGAEGLGTVSDEHLDQVRWIALNVWSLRRANRLTLTTEPLNVSAWAQDNGKAGYLAGSEPGTGTWATLTPRYASQNEIRTVFMAGESFLMDGLQAAGHSVIHSPLLFQGGNLIVAHDPRRQERLLLLGETTLYRNMALGLSQEQVLAAFQTELGVDRCVVLPVVSYHLDYDVTLRVHDGAVLAFVNDAAAAARIIVQRGLEVLAQNQVLPAGQAQAARADLEADRVTGVLRTVASALTSALDPQGRYRTNLVRRFAAGPTDAPGLNFQCFLAALDVLASRALTGAAEPTEPLVRDYYAALREMEAAAGAQRDTLRRLGWTLVLIPSMPDLYRSVNYLNGLQERSRWVMPVWGGLYAGLDQAAANAFRQALGDGVRISRIFSQGLQSYHGGVHCAASAYPRLVPPPNAQSRLESPVIR